MKVQHGWIALSGEVDWNFERVMAESAVRKLGGVLGVTNRVTVTPVVTPSNVQERIEKALERNAHIEADHVKVSVADGKVMLDGSVITWRDREVIERAAWSSPGVSAVENHLKVGRLGVAV